MTGWKTLRRGGFTLVELLIVIVVIAVLAAISFVAYNGITERAHNSHMVSLARNYHQALVQYGSDHGEYPTSVNVYGVCLGDGYEDSHCWRGPNGNYFVNADFDALLSEYIGKKPTVPQKSYPVTAVDSRSGLVYYRNNPTGRQSFEYFLSGRNKECSLAGAVASNVASNTATRCQLTLASL